MLKDPAVMKNVLADKPVREEFFKAYALQIANKDGGLQKQINEQLQTGMAEFLKANDVQGNFKLDLSADGHPDLKGFDSHAASVFSRARKQSLYNKAAPGHRLDGIFNQAGD